MVESGSGPNKCVSETIPAADKKLINLILAGAMHISASLYVSHVCVQYIHSIHLILA
jgi:hypothetical protein